MMIGILLNIVAWIHIGFWVVVATLLYAIYNDILPIEKPLSKLEPKWFGPGSRKGKDDMTIKDFKIDVTEEDVKDLKERLIKDIKRLRSNHPEPMGEDFEYGFNSELLIKELGEYWLSEYDWRSQEKILNAMGSHHKTVIDGIDVHFIRVKPVQPTKKKILPLLLVHGWPGSFVEFIKIAPMLTKESDDRDFVFDVIVPSIPGYGFSDAPRQQGFNYGHAARIFKTLMVERIGCLKFYTQAGDWGWAITTAMAVMYPEHVQGTHLNLATSPTASSYLKLLIGAFFPSLVFEPEEHLKYYGGSVLQRYKTIMLESGYFHIQATRPDTIGAALNTSPLGLAAYIIEKFATLATIDNKEFTGKEMFRLFTKDELLNNVMVYWWTGTIQSSARFYKENSGGMGDAHFMQLTSQPSYVPTGISINQRDIICQPKTILKGKYRNIVSYTEQTRGGHFFAYEEPELLAKDIVKFVSIVGGTRKTHPKEAKKDL